MRIRRGPGAHGPRNDARCKRLCAYAVIEASWVYWKPLRRIIEANLHMMFDQQSRNVLGHIIDVDNAMWIVMSAHGLNR